MMESDYDLPSLHCYTMNPASTLTSDTMATSHPPTTQQQQQQQQQQNVATMTPSTNSTTTPLKRTRAKRSCDFCRQRKSRCDADTCTPCTNCKAWGYTCEFQTVRKKRGPPSVYVDNLEKRCKKMEQLLMQLTNTTIKDLEQNDFRTTHRRAISDPSIVSDSSSDEDQASIGQGYSPSTPAIVPSRTIDNSKDAFMTPCSSSTTATTATTTTTNSTPVISLDSISTNSNNDNDDDPDSIVHRLGQLDIHDYDSIKYTGQSAGLELLDHQDVFKSKPYIAWPGRPDMVLQMMADDQLMVVRTEKSVTTGKLDTRLDVGISITSAPSSSTSDTASNNAIVNNGNKPAKSLTTRMVTLYFTHLHPIFPIVNKSRFLHLYETESPMLPKVLLQAILAVSFRFAAQHGLFPTSISTQTMAEHYADYFFRKVMKRLQESTRSRLCHVQSGLLATLYLDILDGGDNVESVQWQVLGKAIRMAQDLGLHRTCEHWQLPASEIETRHRVFYACYVLDRWIGARAGKPLTILDRDFDTTLPSMYEVVDQDDNNDNSDTKNPVYRAFYLWIKLSEILGRVLKALYAPSAKKANSNANLDDPMILVVFDRRLKHWHSLLEESVDNSYLPSAQNVSLQIYYNTVILLLRRPFLSSSKYFVLEEHLVTESRHISLQAALNIFQLSQQNKLQQTATTIDDRSFAGPSHLLPTCYVYGMFLSSLVHVAIVLHDRTSIKKRHALEASIGLIESHRHLCASRRALEILNMLVTIHEIKNSPDDDGMQVGFKPIKLEQQQDSDEGPSYMISNYNNNHDETLDAYYTANTTATADGEDGRNNSDTITFHHHQQQSSFDSNFMTPCPPPSTTTPTSSVALPTTSSNATFIDSEMPKSHWFQRFVNTSVVGGVTSEIQHDVETDLSHQPTSYICPPPPPSSMLSNNNNSSSTASHLIAASHLHSSPTSMFYTPYMPSPPMPSSITTTPTSPSSSVATYPPHHHHQHQHHHHHLPLLSSIEPSSTSFDSTTTTSTTSSSSSSAPLPPHHRTTCSMLPTEVDAAAATATPPLPPMPLPLHPSPPLHQQPTISPSNLNWHDWQFYMHQHPPSSHLSK
ncbi:fungal-specific transcription factor domain-domain-containing protein [Absidia repens]|uniref:Fungal-specific transcription factor domain-domain-containing protein n=1 Tax=Absidia repens TaxID=90262 RepID=A0A1X2HZR3_9FUNG|nr:fungal-specific transcription factor domain-domain-containing protein [Absidia repens]